MKCLIHSELKYSSFTNLKQKKSENGGLMARGQVEGSPVRLVRVVDAPVVPHPNVRRAGVVTHVTLVHFWHAAF